MNPTPTTEQQRGRDDDEDFPDPTCDLAEPCHRCGSTRGFGGYGRAGGVLGSYMHCADCNALLELSPDNEGLTEEEAKECDEAAAKALAFHRLNGRQRWLAARRERKRTAYKRRAMRKAIDRMIANDLGEKPRRSRGCMHVTTLTASEWL